MLSDQSLEIAHRIVTQLKQRGIKLTPREGTPVALLVGGMPAMPSNLMPGQYVDVIARDAMGHGAVHGAESLHDEEMQAFRKSRGGSLTKIWDDAAQAVKEAIS